MSDRAADEDETGSTPGTDFRFSTYRQACTDPASAETGAQGSDQPVFVEPIWAPRFDITFNYTDGNTSYRAAANAAAAFWELAIIGDLPDAGGVDDLSIDTHLGLIGFANGSDGAGNVLANAGPRQLRSGSALPYTGEMGIDPADVSNAGLIAIITHEIGHVLGLPHIGRVRGLVQDIGDETRFTGSNALSEYRILANNSALSFIPMQGPQGGHWSEDVFGAELLTPFINTSQPAPLSRMSLAALRDFGYTVDLGYADPFALGDTLGRYRDDRAGNFNSNAVLALNGSVAGTIELAEDNDWYRVALDAGTTYTFDLSGSATGAGSLVDPFLMLRSLDGGVLASNDDNGIDANARIAFTASVTGTYFLDASASGVSTGSYTLSASTGVRPVAGSVSVDDVSVTEGHTGSSVATFTLTRSGGTAAFAVSYATADDTATAGRDYVAGTGTVNFAAGVMSQTVSVVVNGDTVFEPNERFFVNLSGATNGAIIGDGQGVGTIVDDVAPDPDGLPLVDDRFYYAMNPDVAAARIDAELHYSLYGWREGRDPNAFFSTAQYLSANPDMRAANVDPLAHYDAFGWREGRDPSVHFDNEFYLARNADVARAGLNPLVHYLAYGQAEGRQAHEAVGRTGEIAAARGFDAEYYLLGNADVARAALSSGASDSFAFAYQHYQNHGWREGRDPNAVFDTSDYLGAYDDVRAASMDPLAHFDRHGWREGRDPSVKFDTSDYLAQYGDVARAGIDPMIHYLTDGLYEGRSAFADGRFG